MGDIMLVINLFGAPGAGKSTAAAYIFANLKMKGINCELITEYAKDKLYEGSIEVFNNQLYLMSKQYFRMTRCYNKVDCIITDSPVLLSIIYNNNITVLDKTFNDLVYNIFNSFNNLNYFLYRSNNYVQQGRFQTEEESDEISFSIKNLLDDRNILYTAIQGIISNYNKIVDKVYLKLKMQ